MLFMKMLYHICFLSEIYEDKIWYKKIAGYRHVLIFLEISRNKIGEKKLQDRVMLCYLCFS